MIAKGASRSGPRQLAVYLMRVERYETGEPVELLELNSPWASSLNGDSDRSRIASRLIETFRDWQADTEGTKQGRDGLYHAEISPEARYAATMTPEQWKRAAVILGEELGLQDQERAIVLHGGTDGRKHMHIVWARTDLDAMKMISDSGNYDAHERASLRMELEFGQEIVPGKHSKRDREKQPEFPRAESDQADHQQAERTGMSFAERKAQLAGIRKPCDDVHAFRNALEEAGYILAKGDTRGFVLVDGNGEVFSLSKHLAGDLKGKAYKDFMAPIDKATLPTIKEAKAIHEQRQKEAPVKAEGAVEEAPQPQSPPGPEKTEQSTPAQQDAKKPAEIEKPVPATYDYELYSPVKKSSTSSHGSKFLPPETAPVQGVEQSKFVAPEAIQLPSVPVASAAEVQEPAPAAGESPEVLAIRKAVAERQAEDAEKWADYDALQLSQLEYNLTVMNAGKTGDFDHIQEAELKALTDKHAERRTGIKGVLDGLLSRLNPTLAAEKARDRQKEFIALISRQRQERKDYLALIEQTKQLELDNLKERHGLQRDRREAGNIEEAERYVREHEDAKRIAEDLKAQQIHEELEHNDSLREGPPPPEKGK
jgi:hypothetical protein